MPSLTGLRGPRSNRFRGPAFSGHDDVRQCPGHYNYVSLLSGSGCEVRVAEDTGWFPSRIDLYLNMIELQLTYDVSRTVGFCADVMQTLTDGFRFLSELSRVA